MSPSVTTGFATEKAPVNGVAHATSNAKIRVSDVLRVEHLRGDFASRAVSKVSLSPGALFSQINGATPGTPSYLTVQTSPTTHITLNSDLQWVNHSCEPTLEFDMAKMEVRVSRNLKDGLKEGDELTFFYPSSEWAMEQPFQCRCKTEGCLGTVQGAKYLKAEDWDRFWFNDHIVLMRSEGENNGKPT